MCMYVASRCEGNEVTQARGCEAGGCSQRRRHCEQAGTATLYIYIYISLYIYMYVCIYIYIYMCMASGQSARRESARPSIHDRELVSAARYIYIYIYIYIYMHM